MNGHARCDDRLCEHCPPVRRIETEHGDVRWHVQLPGNPYGNEGRATLHLSCAAREEAVGRLG